MPGMILLAPGNRILEECVRSQIMAEGKRDPCDVRLNDFDDVSYRIQVEKDNVDTMKVSMNLPCFGDIGPKGAQAALDREFGEYKGDAEVGYDMTLHIKMNEIKDKEGLIKKLSLFKYTVTGGVFDYHFTHVLEGKECPNFKFYLRSDTTVYMCPGADRCTVVFALDFSEKTDKVIAKVFLQELEDARKKIGRAPPTKWGTNPPTELAAFGVTENQGNLGYISFAILKSHLEAGKKDGVINVLQGFRTFLQYHIKSSKTHFHSKMRNRVKELLKVLNRAKVEDPTKVKKIASGKTFTRK